MYSSNYLSFQWENHSRSIKLEAVTFETIKNRITVRSLRIFMEQFLNNLITKITFSWRNCYRRRWTLLRELGLTGNTSSTLPSSWQNAGSHRGCGFRDENWLKLLKFPQIHPAVHISLRILHRTLPQEGAGENFDSVHKCEQATWNSTFHE